MFRLIYILPFTLVGILFCIVNPLLGLILTVAFTYFAIELTEPNISRGERR